MYLKEKKQSNESFHLDTEFKEYAAVHKITKIYNLSEFMDAQYMHRLDTDNLLVLQPVFNQVCRIINKDQQQLA